MAGATGPLSERLLTSRMCQAHTCIANLQVLDLYPSRYTSKHLATNNNQGKMVEGALSTSYPVAGAHGDGDNTQLASGQGVQMAHQQVRPQQQPKVPHGTSIV